MTEFYKYPRNFETRQYTLERRTDGFHIVYEVKRKGEEEILGTIEVISKTKEVKERSGWRNAKFSGVQEEVKEYLRRLF